MNTLTIAICTRNRPNRLEGLLFSIEAQKKNNLKFSVLIADNSSNENINQNQRNKKYNFTIKWDFLKIKGLSNARNYCLENSHSDYIAFFDDDSKLCENYLKSFNEIIKNTNNPEVVCGPIEPIWPKYKPDWIPTKYEECLTILDRGKKARYFDHGEFAYGTNLILRKDVAIKHGKFSTALGRQGKNNLLSSEEIEIQEKIKKSNGKIFYSPKLKVYHLVHEDRLSPNYLSSRMAWQAVSDLISNREIDIKQNYENLKIMSKHNFSNSFENFFNAVELSEKKIEDLITFNILLTNYLLTKHLMDNSRISEKEETLFIESMHEIKDNKKEKNDIMLFKHADDHEFLYYSLLKKNAPKKIFNLKVRPYFQIIDYNYIFKIIKINKIKKIFFVTLDPLLFGISNKEFVEIFLRKCIENNIEIFGIIHRYYQNNTFLNFKKKNKLKIIFLSKRLQISFNKKFNLISKNQLNIYCPSNTIEISEIFNDFKKDENSFILMGSIREGKNFELIEKFFQKLHRLRPQIYTLNIVGKIEDNYISIYQKTIENLKTINVKIIYDIHKKIRSNELSGSKFFDETYINTSMQKSQFCFLLYSSSQKETASATLSNIIPYNIIPITLENTEVSDIVQKYNLGLVLKKDFSNLIDLYKIFKSNVNMVNNRSKFIKEIREADIKINNFIGKK